MRILAIARSAGVKPKVVACRSGAEGVDCTTRGQRKLWGGLLEFLEGYLCTDSFVHSECSIPAHRNHVSVCRGAVAVGPQGPSLQCHQV